jgi:hypothetical protein
MCLAFLLYLPDSAAQEKQESSALNKPLKRVERSEDQAFILEVRIKREIISEGIFAYANSGSLLIPLGEMMQLLGLPITVNASEGYADGWFISEDRTFTLEIPQNRIILSGEISPLPPASVELHENEIYVDVAALSKWLPIDFEFSLSEQILRINPREKLPSQLLKERGLIRERLGNSAEKEIYPREPYRHKMISHPYSDINWNADYHNDAENEIGTDFDVLTRMELMGFNARGFVSGNEDEGLSEVRILLEHKDPDGGLLGPLDATEVELGDIFTKPLPALTSSQIGRGAHVSNFPLERVSEFSQTTVRGDSLPNWDVELYRNDVLLDFQRVGVNGIYEFLDVPLVNGLNTVRLEFYGPFGERRTKIERFLIGPELIKPGKFYYSVAANQQGSDLISVNEDFLTIRDEPRGIAEFQYGISESASIFSYLLSIPLEDDKQHQYATIGSALTLGAVYSRFALTSDVAEGGYAFDMGLQTRYRSFTFTATHEEYIDDMITERTESVSDPVVRRSILNIDGQLPTFVAGRFLNAGFGVEREEVESGRVQTDFTNRLSIFFWRSTLSNTLRYQLLSSDDLDDDVLFRGDFLASARFDQFNLRTELSYSIEPTTELETVTVGGEYGYSQDLTLQGDVSYQLLDEVTVLSAGVNKRFDAFTANTTALYRDTDELEVRLSFSTSIGMDYEEDSYSMFADQIANTGMLNTFVYIDNNADGVFNAGDTPLENAALRIDKASSRKTTNESGKMFLTDLSTYRPLSVTLDRSSVEDPYLVPAVEGKEVVLRPGVAIDLEMALYPTGEIDGVAYMEREGKREAASNVEVELVDASGKVVNKTTSSYDGFFLFELVPPGIYTIRIAEEQMQRLGFTSLITYEGIIIQGNGMVYAGLDMLARQPYDAGAIDALLPLPELDNLVKDYYKQRVKVPELPVN